jgi:hypothetical protein
MFSCPGLCAKAAIYPLDTTKKRLQVSGWQGMVQAQLHILLFYIYLVLYML